MFPKEVSINTIGLSIVFSLGRINPAALLVADQHSATLKPLPQGGQQIQVIPQLLGGFAAIAADLRTVGEIHHQLGNEANPLRLAQLFIGAEEQRTSVEKPAQAGEGRNNQLAPETPTRTPEHNVGPDLVPRHPAVIDLDHRRMLQEGIARTAEEVVLHYLFPSSVQRI